VVLGAGVLVVLGGGGALVIVLGGGVDVVSGSWLIVLFGGSDLDVSSARAVLPSALEKVVFAMVARPRDVDEVVEAVVDVVDGVDVVRTVVIREAVDEVDVDIFSVEVVGSVGGADWALIIGVTLVDVELVAY
jgi:hypothetical protein